MTRTDTKQQDREDDRLVASALEGDDVAFESLICRHESRVLRLIRLLGVNPTDREDLAQEIFIRVFRSLGRYRQGKSFGAWIYRIGVNVVRDHREKQAKRGEAPLSERHQDQAEDPSASPMVRMEALDRRALLESALEELSPRERAVFVLSQMEGLSSAEVGHALGITAITVRRHVGRARERLQHVLKLRLEASKTVEMEKKSRKIR